MERWVPLSECPPFTKNVSVRVIVVKVEESSTLRDGRLLRRLLVADSSGSVSLVVFGSIAQELRPGDVCEIHGAIMRIKHGQNRMFLQERKHGQNDSEVGFASANERTRPPMQGDAFLFPGTSRTKQKQ